jgi:hypothetical protein
MHVPISPLAPPQHAVKYPYKFIRITPNGPHHDGCRDDAEGESAWCWCVGAPTGQAAALLPAVHLQLLRVAAIRPYVAAMAPSVGGNAALNLIEAHHLATCPP